MQEVGRRTYCKRLGIDPRRAKLAVENAKKALGRRGNENVLIDPKSGEIVVVGRLGINLDFDLYS